MQGIKMSMGADIVSVRLRALIPIAIPDPSPDFYSDYDIIYWMDMVPNKSITIPNKPLTILS